MKGLIFLSMILVLGYVARSRVLIITCIILMLLYCLNLFSFINFLHNNGIEIGLVFLLLSILSTVFLGGIDWTKFKDYLLSMRGIIAIIAGLLATQCNDMGLQLLANSPQLIAGIIIGSLIGITLFGGIPVGPLMAAGIAAVLIKLFNLMNWS